MKHTLSVLVENKPGALMRITSMFARRGYNIDSLAVGPTEHEEISRMTIVVVIVNNGYLGMVQQWQNMFFDDRLSHVHLTHQVPDYAVLAGAYGAAGFTVSAAEELEPVLVEALGLGRTAVVDCRVDPREQCFPMIPAGAGALELIEFSEDAEVTS